MADTIFALNGSTLTVQPVGELNSVTSPLFEAEFCRKLPGAKTIIVDCSQMDYISSAGLRVFLTAEQYVEKHGAEMKLIHVNRHILEIFDLVGFRDVVSVEP